MTLGFKFQLPPRTKWVLIHSTSQLKCDGTRAETRFLLSKKRTSPFKSAEPSVQSTTGSRGVRISGSNAGYTMFRGSVKGSGYPFHSPVSPFTSPPVRHRVSSHFNCSLLADTNTIKVCSTETCITWRNKCPCSAPRPTAWWGVDRLYFL